MHRLSLMIVAATALAGVANANPAAGSFRTTTQVPEFCQITASPMVLSSETGTIRGHVLEMCNSPDGYKVVAIHRPLDSSEHVEFAFDGEQNALQADGWSEVARRAGARYGKREINVRFDSLARPLAINLTLTTY